MKLRLKSSSASRGVFPSPLAPRRTSRPIKASQMSPAIPILGRSRAAGLAGLFARYSSTSSFITVGSSSIASEVTSKKTCMSCNLDLKTPKTWRAHEKLRAMRWTHRRRYGHCASSLSPSSRDQSRPQTMATEVVRLPPILNVRNFFAFSIWRAPACPVSC